MPEAGFWVGRNRYNVLCKGYCVINIAVASGKGGTGKTTIATNLAVHLDAQKQKVAYIDCDVEEPNGHLFLNPAIDTTHTASIPVPVVDESRCTACGQCVAFCAYNALVRLGKEVMVFAELCHGCGGCARVCPVNAITEQRRKIGVVEKGRCRSMGFVHGRLDVGVAMSPPLIRAVLSHASAEQINIIDAPPGTSCPVIAAVRKVDFVVLVTEPTPFGINDLALAVDMVEELAIPFGVVVNRAEDGVDDAHAYCRSRNAAVIARIPDDRTIAETYSRGEMIVENIPGLDSCFDMLWNTIRKRVGA